MELSVSNAKSSRPDDLLRSWGLELRRQVSANNKGRGVFAASGTTESHIKPGEDVLVSQPYVYCVSSSQAQIRCHHCLRAVEDPTKLSRCSKCKFCLYCSVDCQRKAWSMWHQQECAALQSVAPARPTETVLLMARLFWRRIAESKSSISSSKDNEKVIDPTYSDVEFLISNRSNFKAEKMEQFGQMAMLVARLVGPSALTSSASELVDLFCKFSCNNYNISDAEFRPIGVGLYPTAALINHSCHPNCIAIFRGTESIIRAVEPIEEGQEITITYVEYTLPKRLRQAELSDHFFFTCDCLRCIDIREAISDDQELVKDDTLIKTLSALHQSETSKEQILIEQLETAAKIAEKTLDILHSYTYYEIQSELQRRYIDSQRWDGASNSAVAVLRFLENVCQQLWPILGLQYFMVGKIYWFREQTDLAINSLNLAFQIMSMTHHGDPLLQELAQLRTEAMLELEMNRKMPGGKFSAKPQQMQIKDK